MKPAPFEYARPGTLAEALFPLLAYRGSGMGTFVMEMPGTYSYREPLSLASEGVYSTVIDFLAAHPGIDAERIGMIGFSFGGYWSTRMAAVESRLKVAVSNGALTHRSDQRHRLADDVCKCIDVHSVLSAKGTIERYE